MYIYIHIHIRMSYTYIYISNIHTYIYIYILIHGIYICIYRIQPTNPCHSIVTNFQVFFAKEPDNARSVRQKSPGFVKKIPLSPSLSP